MDKLGAGTGKGAIQRYRLWKEYKTICPYCLEPITQEELLNGTEIEHIVPQTHVVSNEWENLCNKEKDGRTRFKPTDIHHAGPALPRRQRTPTWA